MHWIKLHYMGKVRFVCVEHINCIVSVVSPLTPGDGNTKFWMQGDPDAWTADETVEQFMQKIEEVMK